MPTPLELLGYMWKWTQNTVLDCLLGKQEKHVYRTDPDASEESQVRT